MKDTNNLLPYTVWSGGDYSQGNFLITNQWSVNGEYSIKNDLSTAWLTLCQDTSLNNVSLTLTANINTKSGGALCIYYRVDGSYKSVKSGFTQDNVGLVSVSAEIPSEATMVWCRLDLVDSSKTIFVDDVNLIVNQ